MSFDFTPPGGNLLPADVRDIILTDGWTTFAVKEPLENNTYVFLTEGQIGCGIREVFTGISFQHKLNQVTGLIAKADSAIRYTVSLYVKRLSDFAIGDPRNIVITLSDDADSSGAYGIVDLGDGSVLDTAAYGSPGYTSVATEVIAVGDDWWRIQLKATSDTEETLYLKLEMQNPSSGDPFSWPGDDVSGYAVAAGQYFQLFQGEAVFTRSLDGEAPEIDSPTLGTVHVLDSMDIVTGAPVIGEPAIAAEGVTIADLTPFVNRALQMIGTQTTVVSLDENSNEAIEASKLVHTVRRQALRAAPWNFARRNDFLQLLKAAPGTREYEHTGFNPRYWTPLFPAPAWMYEYAYPEDCIQANAIRGQFQGVVGKENKFAVASDVVGVQGTYNNFVDSNTTNLVLAPAHAGGTYGGQKIYVNDGNGHYGWSVVSSYDPSTNKVTFGEIPGLVFGSNAYAYLIGVHKKVILSNQPVALLRYTFDADQPDLWDVLFEQAYVSALAGFLCFQLTGSLQLAQQLIGQANAHVVAARTRDSNEGLEVHEHVPDWLTARTGEPSVPSVPFEAEQLGPLFQLGGM